MRDIFRFKPLLIAFIYCFLSVNMALAGDFARKQVLGFSPDGRFFAFEQYGRQLPSGFPYADLFILDTRSGKWMNRTPFRSLLFSPQASVQDARAQTQQKASTLLGQLQIGWQGEHLVHNPAYELMPDRHETRFRIERSYPPKGFGYQLKLNSFEVAASGCAISEGRARAFQLVFKKLGPFASSTYLVKNGTELSSGKVANCPVNYAIEDVFVFDPKQTKGHLSEAKLSRHAVLTVLLRIVESSFSGKNIRYMAIARSGLFANEQHATKLDQVN